jgi:autotransporter-associated beta strand protein
MLGSGTGPDAFLTMTGGTLTYLGTDGVVLGSSTTAGIIDALTINGSSSVATLTGITLDKGGSSGANSTFTLGTGATLYLGSVGIVEDDGAPVTGAISLGTGTVGAIASWTTGVTTPITLTGNTVFQTANSSGTPFNITLNGTVEGSGGLTETGTGTLTLSGPNEYTGATAVNSGTLLATSNLTGSSSINVASGATLDLTGTSNSTTGSITNYGTIILGSGVSLTASSGGAFTNFGTLNLLSDPSYVLPSNFANGGNGTVLRSGSSPTTNPTDTPTMPQWALLILAMLLFFAATPFLAEKRTVRE